MSGLTRRSSKVCNTGGGSSSFLPTTAMGNRPSSSAGPIPASTRYQSGILPDSFFAEETTTEIPPLYSITHNRRSLISDTDVSDRTRIIFKSSDGRHFSLSRRDVDAHAGALVPENWSPGRMVDLTETSNILEMLFQFIGARQHPKLLNESFEFLARVAKAAEKYKVFSAMNTCSERMRSFGDRHPKLVLLYAARHDYPHIVDECASRVVTSENLQSYTSLLPEHLRLPWVRYHTKWCKALSDATCYPSIPSDAWASSKCWRDCGQPIFYALGMGVHSLHEPSWVFVDRVKNHTDGCKKCNELCKKWHTHAETAIRNVGVFSEIYREPELPVNVNSS